VDHKGLRLLFIAHGLITLGAGIVLVIAPAVIPRAVGIDLDPDADVLAYLLASAEFGLAVLSFGASQLTNREALRLIVWGFIVFHGSAGVLETYAFFKGVSVKILGNVAARAAVIALFAYFAERDRFAGARGTP
jgi:hypothetical protein